MTTITRPAATSMSRFLAAQGRVYPRVINEIRRGHKDTHWMWFIFPQLRGLAKSETARYFGLADRGEAVAYLDNGILRTRLFECAMGVLGQKRLMFGDTDTRKLRSCMTLFRTVADDPALPDAVLSKFFGGLPDPYTIDLLEGRPIPREVTTMSRHWERQIAKARAVVEAVGRREAPLEPWTRQRVTSFVRGFGLSTVATRQMVDAWMADQSRARDDGYQEGWASREEW